MPNEYGYEAVVWVIREGIAVMQFGMKTFNPGRAVDYAFSASELFRKTSTESGYVTVSDLSNGRELERIDFNQTAKAAAC
jgi:hypothetical protein